MLLFNRKKITELSSQKLGNAVLSLKHFFFATANLNPLTDYILFFHNYKELKNIYISIRFNGYW